jgi:hypothetical protein
MRSILSLCALAAVLAACGANPPGNTTPASRGGARLINESEVEQSTAATAYDLIQQLRPRWLVVASGPTTLGREPEIMVYVNDMKVGGPQNLYDIDVNAIRRVSFMDANEATGRFGLNHSHGAIMVSLKVGAPR